MFVLRAKQLVWTRCPNVLMQENGNHTMLMRATQAEPACIRRDRMVCGLPCIVQDGDNDTTAIDCAATCYHFLIRPWPKRATTCEWTCTVLRYRPVF
jgi:hypothetical protein